MNHPVMAVAILNSTSSFRPHLARDPSRPTVFNLSNTISIVYISSLWIFRVVVLRTWST